ncbi:MAG: DNA polymerase I, partial [Defluviitaleaceae bacterium]|nr:DNA polymerase I [Defluviitaleaceae bacterium]
MRGLGRIDKKLLLVDGHSILNRGFYAIPSLTNGEGVFTNAVFGFLNVFVKLFEEEKPEYVIVAFDVPKKTFRHEQYAPYKGTRKPMPDELRPQVPLLKHVLAKMGIHTAECPGFEADDVIGTLAAQAKTKGIETVILSGDRDLLQLAGERTTVRIPKSKAGKTEIENYKASDVLERYGVTPREYIDVKALMGDASDNIPGVPGIGEVTATKIVAAFGSVENAIERANEIKPAKAADSIVSNAELAILSKRLATISLDAPVEFSESESAVCDMWNESARDEFVRLEFKSFLSKFSKTTAAHVKNDYRLIV